MAILLWGLARATAMMMMQPTAQIWRHQKRYARAQQCIADWLACCIAMFVGVATICKCPAMMHC